MILQASLQRCPGLRRLAAGLLLALAALTFFGAGARPAHADPITDLQNQIAADQRALEQIAAQLAQIGAAQADARQKMVALEAVIARLDSQLRTVNAELSAEQAKLDVIKAEEQSLEGQIKVTEADLARRQAAFDADVRSVDKQQQVDPLLYLFGATSFADLLQRSMGLSEVSSWNHGLAQQLKSDRDRLLAEQEALAAERAQEETVVATMQQQQATLQQEYDVETQASDQLAALQAQLGVQQQSLTVQTAQLDSQISSDQAQINNLLAFSERHGNGGDIVAPEYLSDSWGTYYNQRDARWGNDYMGNSPYEVWQIGCLMTSVAMTWTHFGYGYVTPATLASNPNDFSPGGEMYNAALDVTGHPATQVWSPTVSWMNSWLDGGGTLIVGMNIYTGGTHFVVITGRDGAADYWINDPWDQDAMHIPFSQSPNVGPIYEAIGYR